MGGDVITVFKHGGISELITTREKLTERSTKRVKSVPPVSFLGLQADTLYDILYWT